MKKYTVLVVPVAIALLTFGIPGKSMAGGDKGGSPPPSDPTTIASYNNIDDGNSYSKSDSKSVSVSKSVTVNKNKTENKDDGNTTAMGNGGAAAISGSAYNNSDNEVAKGELAVVGNVTLNVKANVSVLSGAVSGNSLSVGDDLENNNTAKGNSAKSSSDQVNVQKDKAKQASGNALGQGQLSVAKAGSVNFSSGGTDGDRDDHGKSDGSKSSSSAKASSSITSGNGAGPQTAGNNDAADSNAGYEASVASAGKFTNNNSQINEVSLTTGANVLTGTITANGITTLSLNNGIQSSNQASVTIQASNSNIGTIATAAKTGN